MLRGFFKRNCGNETEIKILLRILLKSREAKRGISLWFKKDNYDMYDQNNKILEDTADVFIRVL